MIAVRHLPRTSPPYGPRRGCLRGGRARARRRLATRARTAASHYQRRRLARAAGSEVIGDDRPALAVACVTPSSIRTAVTGAAATDRFEIGSISKGLTGLLLADMIERGEVRADTRLGTLLPVTGALAEVTLSQLATHTSGLPTQLPTLRQVGRNYWASMTAGNPYDGSVQRAAGRSRGGGPRRTSGHLLQSRVRAARRRAGGRGRSTVSRSAAGAGPDPGRLVGSDHPVRRRRADRRGPGADATCRTGRRLWVTAAVAVGVGVAGVIVHWRTAPPDGRRWPPSYTCSSVWRWWSCWPEA